MPILNKISMGIEWIYPYIRIYLFVLPLLIIGTAQVFANDYTRLAVYDPVGDQWHDILAELAETPEQRQIGLMHRQYLAERSIDRRAAAVDEYQRPVTAAVQLIIHVDAVHGFIS